MRARSSIVVAACLTVGLTACSTLRHQSGDAAPAGSPASATPAASAVSTAISTAPASTVATTPQSSGPAGGGSGSSGGGQPSTTLELGPAGYGALKLGMTRQQAQASGLVAGYSTNSPNPSCPQARLSGAPTGQGVVWFSPSHNVVAIGAYGSVATPQGVRLGMTGANMRRIYPDWTALGTNANGRGYAKVPGNAAAEYRIEVTNGTVTSLTLQASNEPCYE